jgi:hypothetical protein
VQALFPLPNPSSYLFSQSLASSENLDESELNKWDCDPPYAAEDYPDGSQDEMIFTERLIEVMHGRRLRQERESDQEREELFQEDQTSPEMQISWMRCELAFTITHWETLDDCVAKYQAQDREYRMASHRLQWAARTAYHIAQLLKERKSTIM